MARVGKSTIGSTKLVEERMDHGFNGRETFGGSVLKKRRDQLNSVLGGFTEYLEQVSLYFEAVYGKTQEVRVR